MVEREIGGGGQRRETRGQRRTAIEIDRKGEAYPSCVLRFSALSYDSVRRL